MWRSITPACSILLILAFPAHAQDRPEWLVPLYVTHVTLQGLDVHSTTLALDRGHREKNPLFLDGDVRKIIGVKVAASVVSVWMAERLWKSRPRAAVWLMVGINAGMTAVVANNYRVANKPGG